MDIAALAGRPLLDGATSEGESARDIFEEGAALQACLQYLAMSASDKGLNRAAQKIEDAILAIDSDLYAYSN